MQASSLRSIARKAFSPSVFKAGPTRASATRTMAAKSGIDMVVKGVPAENKLGDCPFCHRVLLTLATKGVPFDYTYIDFAHKPDWLVASPPEGSGGKVPVLRKEGVFMPDSDVIVQYLEEQYPTPSMKPHVDNSFFSKLLGAFREFKTSTPDQEAEKREALTSELRRVEEALSKEKGPLFGGASMDATDAALAPRLYHIQVAAPHFKGYTIPDEFKHIKAYLDYIKTLPAWKAVDYGPDMIIAGWAKH